MKPVIVLLCFLLILNAITSTYSVQCKVGAHFILPLFSGFEPIKSVFSTVECPGVNTRCLRADINVTARSTPLEGSVIYAIGMCEPRLLCSYTSCDAFNAFLGSDFTNAWTINSCDTACCNTNNCNAETAKVIGPNENPEAVYLSNDGTGSGALKLALNFSILATAVLLRVAVMLFNL